MSDRPLDTHHKALRMNRDRSNYGTFAEIGAGQEVARWFFRVGAAAGTIAKSISAYDMVVSDAIYGPTDRYVSRRRLAAMLDHEYSLLVERLNQKRGTTTKFFAFANTVTARSYKQRGESHGWLGIRFQTQALSEPCDIWIHVRMLDRENLQQQEALGIMGVNLIYSALYLHENPATVINSLMDSLTPERVEVDMIRFSGPAFSHLDNRLMALELLQQGLANSAMFTATGEVVQAAEVLFDKPILVERGSFRPVTNVAVDMLRSAEAKFHDEARLQREDVVVLTEMTMNNLITEGKIDPQDFLDRADLLATLGKYVLISNYGEYYRLAAYLFRYTKEEIRIVLGVPALRELFDEKYYGNLEGGILDSFGRLFKKTLKVYVYPVQDSTDGSVTTAASLVVAPHLRHLQAYLLENQFIVDIARFDRDYLPILSKEVLTLIKGADPRWQQLVPPAVARIIKERHLFGCAA